MLALLLLPLCALQSDLMDVGPLFLSKLEPCISMEVLSRMCCVHKVYHLKQEASDP